MSHSDTAQSAEKTTEIEQSIRAQIKDHPVLLYMKGRPDAPQCGFSAQVVDALVQCGVEFAFVDILSQPEIRTTLPKIADWPTFPQLWVQGELIGGADIITQMHEKGELEALVKNPEPN